MKKKRVISPPSENSLIGCGPIPASGQPADAGDGVVQAQQAGDRLVPGVHGAGIESDTWAEAPLDLFQIPEVRPTRGAEYGLGQRTRRYPPGSVTSSVVSPGLGSIFWRRR